MDSKIPLYEGYLDQAKCSKAVKYAIQSYHQQVGRCHNPKHKRFYQYGAKGISVKYGTREFVSWWLYHLKTFIGDCPTVGRIDHAGHYEFSNITLQDRAENSKERMQRTPPHNKRPVICYDYKTMTPLMVFNCAMEAQIYSGVKRSNIWFMAAQKPRMISGKMTVYKCTLDGFTFRYA